MDHVSLGTNGDVSSAVVVDVKSYGRGVEGPECKLERASAGVDLGLGLVLDVDDSFGVVLANLKDDIGNLSSGLDCERAIASATGQRAMDAARYFIAAEMLCERLNKCLAETED
jgi:hypothetical protein